MGLPIFQKLQCCNFVVMTPQYGNLIMKENFSHTLFYWIDKKMFSLNFIQILGLLLFFFGLIVLNRCNQVEHMDYLTRSLSETMHSAKSDLEERETTRQLVRKSLLYSSMGIFVSLGGMAMFFVSAS